MSEMGEACNTHGTEEKCRQILDRKPRRKSSFGRLTYICEYDIKIYFEEIPCGTVWTRFILLKIGTSGRFLWTQ
jgi:hypothetical protein